MSSARIRALTLPLFVVASCLFGGQVFSQSAYLRFRRKATSMVNSGHCR